VSPGPTVLASGVVLLRPTIWLLLAFLIAFLALARPVSAESGLVTQQERVKHQLVAAAAEVSQLDLRIAELDRTIADTDLRVQRERQQVRLIARTMYAESDSALMALLGASSLADALTRFSDLTAAGDRAAVTERALRRDLEDLQAAKATAQVDRQRAGRLREQLDARFRALQRMIEASAAQAQAASRQAAMPQPPTTAPAPAAPPGAAPPPPPVLPPPAAPSSIQQIILAAFAPLGSAAQAWALRVARCESNFNPNAVNRSSAASGLFQFLPSTWAGTPQGKAGRSVFDPTANAQAAAWYYKATGQTGGPWSCK
jgi:soluble lytic murein transglycosylase-like protein